MPTYADRPVAALTPATHARLLALAARWKVTPSISILNINHDRLIAAGLALLEAAIPWEELESGENAFKVLGKVVAMLPGPVVG